jgi:hypothetical protein
MIGGVALELEIAIPGPDRGKVQLKARMTARSDSQISANVSEYWSETEVGRGVRDTAAMGGKSRCDADVFSRSTSDR